MIFAQNKVSNHQRGLAAVEFVFVLPFLLLLMLVSAELGRAFYQYNTLTKTVRDGARYLADNSLIGTTGIIDITDEESNTQNLVVYGNRLGNGQPLLPGLVPGDITVVQLDSKHIRVSVTYVYLSILGVPIPSFGLGTGNIATNFTFTAQSSMRAL
jgi:hypothetical protein